MAQRRRMVLWLGCLVVVFGLHARPAAAAVPGPCQTGVFPSGALWMVCVPASGWNNQLVVFGHGYVPPQAPLGFYNQEIDGASLPVIVQALGYAFAATSYSKNGVAILQGVDDVRDLVTAAPDLIGAAPTRVWLVGASEGALITALATERYPELVSGNYSLCGPIGTFRYQTDHVGHFRVLFDYFFKGVIPGAPFDVPLEVQLGWETVYRPRVLAAMAADPARAAELFRVARVPVDASDPAQAAGVALTLLQYNIFGTADAVATLGGQPFGNRLHWYSGSRNDTRLNKRVARVSADAAALRELRKYATTGRIARPVVTLHTTGDGVVPVIHELLYAVKVRLSEQGSFLPIPVLRYGHCNFTTGEVVAGFGLLVAQ